MDNLDHDGRLERSVQRYYGGEDALEKAQEDVDEELEQHILDDDEAGDDFLCFVLRDCPSPKLFPDARRNMTLEQLIDAWLLTEFGAKWYAGIVESVANGMNEEGVEHDD